MARHDILSAESSSRQVGSRRSNENSARATRHLFAANLVRVSEPSIGETAADTLPSWLSGLPKDAPPRRGTPEYDAWMTQRAEEAARPKDRQ